MLSIRRSGPVVPIALWLTWGWAISSGAWGGPPLFPNLPGSEMGKEADKDDLFSRPLFSDAGGPSPRVVGNERALFALACSYFDQRAYTLCADTLRDFLGRYPRSRQAAEARYRLAQTLQLQGKADEAGRLFDELLDKHPQSPFARLVLEVHYNEEQLRTLANDELRRARDPDRHSRASKALELLVLYGKRFPEGPLRREVLVYKLGICYRLLDQPAEHEAAMKSIGDNAPHTPYARLAACWMDRGQDFQKHLDEIVQLHADGEELMSFLELADKLGPRMEKKARIHCLFLQGLCLHQLHRDLETEKLWRRLIRTYPRSPEAPEALFWLAEHYYQRKDLALAQQAYEELLAHYPDSPRVEAVRRWLSWLDEHDSAWDEAERLLAEWTARAANFKGGVSFMVRLQGGQGTDDVKCRVAFQDREHYLLCMNLGPERFLLASNRSGGWYHSSRERFVVHTRDRIALMPIPHLQWKLDPLTGAAGVSFGTGRQSRSPAELSPFVKLPWGWTGQTISWLQEGYHLRRQVHKVAGGTERIVYRLEAARPADTTISSWEVETDSRQRLCAARRVFFNDKHEQMVWELSGVQVADKLPAGTLSLALPADVPVQERRHVSMVELVGELCAVGGKLLDPVLGGEEEAEPPAKK